MSMPGVPFLPGLPLCPCHDHGICPDLSYTPEALERGRAFLEPMTPDERAAFIRDMHTDSGVSAEAEIAYLLGNGPDPTHDDSCRCCECGPHRIGEP